MYFSVLHCPPLEQYCAQQNLSKMMFGCFVLSLWLSSHIVACEQRIDTKFKHITLASNHDSDNVKCPTYHIQDSHLDQALKEGVLVREQIRDIENQMDQMHNVVNTSVISSTARHVIPSPNKEKIRLMHHEQRAFEEASKVLAKNFSLSLNKIRDLSQIQTEHLVHVRSKRQACKPPIFCNRNRFRTADGSCNNLRNPRWGKSFECIVRLLDPEYSDGISRPRVSKSGNALPNPRVLSGTIHPQEDVNANFTHMLMQWGQFLDHDISLSPVNTLRTGGIKCCPRPTHPDCFSIEIPPNDPVFGRENKRCLNFVRSVSCQTCRFGPRLQVNELTAFIDASNIYGNAQEETRSLRLFNSGLLAFDTDQRGNIMLPRSNDIQNDQCSDSSQRQLCFRAGDNSRVNQHPGLTALHTIWLRQHNRIAALLNQLNGHWNDERLFQETRRIVGAQMQMITYNEFLPVVLGANAMNFYKLSVQNNGFTNYDSNVNPSIIGEFSGAAYRFGHSIVNGRFTMITANSRRSSFMLKDNFFTPNRIRDGQLDMIMRGLVGRSAQRFDPFCHSDLRNHLYRSKNEKTGSDLPAMNIQRGRDHAIPGYIKYVKLCFEDEITSFEQLDQYMPQSQRLRFQQHYEHVEDIDLFSGGISELPLIDGVVGPTFACIMGVQFNHLKFGDRFYFEHGGQDGSFTSQQLQSLRKTLFSKVICENGDDFQMIHRKVFLLNSDRNPDQELRSCKDILDIDLAPWKE